MVDLMYLGGHSTPQDDYEGPLTSGIHSTGAWFPNGHVYPDLEVQVDVSFA